MLRELRIENFALVDRLAVEFSAGLNVLTGETGAGKTILLEAIVLLLGGRSVRPPVREGADEARIQGFFDLSGRTGFPFADLLDEEGGILIERRIPRSGRGRVEANGRLLPLEKLRALGRDLVDFHGQQERENLLDRSLQRSYLDRYAGAAGDVASFREAAAAFAEARRARISEEEEIGAAREREEFLRWQAREIDDAALRAGEEEELEGEVKILGEAERLGEAVWRVRETLREGDRSAIELIGGAAELLERFAGHGEHPSAAAEACRRALVEIEEALQSVDALAARVDAPPGALEEAIGRLETIASLKRKHRRSLEEILVYREEIGAELARIDGGEELLGRLGAEEKRRQAEASEAARLLSEKRMKKAKTLGRAIEKGVRPLALKAARFEVRVERSADPEGDLAWEGERYRAGPAGVDRIEFLFAANRGEPLLPLRQVASGGEISRVMLAVKRALADAAPTPTAVFDEIDVGVGGDVGERIADALADLGEARQILCITHLPAIASRGETHLHVAKKTRGGRTVVSVAPLEGEERVEELVRMLGGKSRREVSVPHAEEILRAARRSRG